MKLLILFSVTLLTSMTFAQKTRVKKSTELESMTQILREKGFAYQGKYSGEFDEIFSLESHNETKGVFDINDQISARKIIERDLKSLNTPNNLRKCKRHLSSTSIISKNLKNFLKQGNYQVEYEYEFAGRISTTRKNDQQENNLHRNYRCHFIISNEDSNSSFWSSYYLKNREFTESECNQLIDNFSKNDKVLVEFKKYMDYRYDTPMSDGVYSFHCAINLSAKN